MKPSFTTAPQQGVVYIAPSGRRCMVCPPMATQRAPRIDEVTLLYHTADGQPARWRGDDGFVLSRRNWHLLRVQAP